MSHVCPECDGANVRRSSTPVAERTWRNTFCTRYRCPWLPARVLGDPPEGLCGRGHAVAAIVLAIVAVVVMEHMNNSW